MTLPEVTFETSQNESHVDGTKSMKVGTRGRLSTTQLKTRHACERAPSTGGQTIRNHKEGESDPEETSCESGFVPIDDVTPKSASIERRGAKSFDAIQREAKIRAPTLASLLRPCSSQA